MAKPLLLLLRNVLKYLPASANFCLMISVDEVFEADESTVMNVLNGANVATTTHKNDDVVVDDDEEDWNLFKLLRSYSLPNLSNTPLETLFATIPIELAQPHHQQDLDLDEVHPVVTFEDEDSEDQGTIIKIFLQ